MFCGFRPFSWFRVSESPADRELYQQQIKAMDRWIDALVYDLYGLTEEEIAIVEEGPDLSR